MVIDKNINEIYDILNKMSLNQDLLSEIKNAKNIDEIFKIISLFDGSINKYDFYLFLDHFLNNNLENVSGGKLDFKKAIAGGLAALALTSSGIKNQFKTDFSNNSSVFSQKVEAAQVTIVPNPWEDSSTIDVLNKSSQEELDSKQLAINLAQNGITPDGGKKDIYYTIMGTYDDMARFKMSEGEEGWNKKVKLAAVSGTGDVAKDSFNLTSPRVKALKHYFYEVIVKRNPSRSINSLKNDPAVRRHFDKFGVFYKSSLVTKIGGRIEEIDGTAKMDEIISEEFQNKATSDINEIKNWLLSHKLLVAGAGGVLLFRPAKDLIKSVFSGMKSGVEKFKKEFMYSRLKYSSNPEEMLQTLQNGLSKVILNQEGVINTVSSKIVGWLMAKHTDNIKENIGSLLFTFLGSSGLGKTLFCKQLSVVVFGREMQKWQFVTNSAIKAEINGVVPADNLFSQDSELVRNLSKNPECIVFLDEVDKWQVNDPKNTILERLRDCKDTGKLMIRKKDGSYDYINVSKSIFILTSNEHNHCWGISDTDLTPDPSRTELKRDISLTRRFDIVEFKKFNAEAYKKVLAPHLQTLSDESLKKYSITIKYADDFLTKLAVECELKDKGARGCNDVIIDLCGQIVMSKNEAAKSGEPLKNIILDFKDHNFVINRDEDEKKSEELETKPENLQKESQEV